MQSGLSFLANPEQPILQLLNQPPAYSLPPPSRKSSKRSRFIDRVLRAVGFRDSKQHISRRRSPSNVPPFPSNWPESTLRQERHLSGVAAPSLGSNDPFRSVLVGHPAVVSAHNGDVKGLEALSEYEGPHTPSPIPYTQSGLSASSLPESSTSPSKPQRRDREKDSLMMPKKLDAVIVDGSLLVRKSIVVPVRNKLIFPFR